MDNEIQVKYDVEKTTIRLHQNKNVFVTTNLINCEFDIDTTTLHIGDDIIYKLCKKAGIKQFVVISDCSSPLTEDVMILINNYYDSRNFNFGTHPLFYIQNTSYYQAKTVRAKLVYYGFETADHLFDNQDHLYILVKTTKETHKQLCKHR